VRRILFLLPLAPLLVLAGTSSVGAANSGPISLPAVQVIAQDACTGGAVRGLSLSLVPTPGVANPGPSQKRGPLTTQWSQANVAPGSYALVVSAPGYVGIGDATAGASPITVEVDPGPVSLVAQSSFAEDRLISVMLAPTLLPPGPCLDLPSLALPALSGSVIDGSTNAPLQDPGPIQLTSPAQANPGPTENRNQFDFAQGTLSPGPAQLSISPAGHYPLGTHVDGSLAPFEVTVGPGPSQLPSGGSYSQGLAVVANVAPLQAPPSITKVSPLKGTSTSEVHIFGTGLTGTYAVTLGGAVATILSFSPTEVTLAPACIGAGVHLLKLANLAGNATVPYMCL